MDPRRWNKAKSEVMLNNVGNINSYNDYQQKYIEKKRIGSGTFGTVVVVEAIGKNRFLAAKFIPLNPDLLKYIEIEIKLLQTFKHPYIMKIADELYIKESSSIEETDKVIIISELAEESLKELIQRKKDSDEMISEE